MKSHAAYLAFRQRAILPVVALAILANCTLNSRAQAPVVTNSPALGIGWRATSGGPLLVEEIDPKGPAANGGLAKGDVLISVDGQDVRTGDALAASLKKWAPGQRIVVQVRRGTENLSRTITMPDTRVNMFGAFLQHASGSRLQVAEVTPNTPAERSGLLKGDVLLSMAGQRPTPGSDFTAFMTKLVGSDKTAGPILLTVERAGKEEPLTLTIERAVATAPGKAPAVGGDVAFQTARPIVLGVTVRQQGGRVVVVRAYDKEPAATAGILAGDLIVSVDKKPIESHAALLAATANVQIGDQVAVEVMRGDKSGVLTVVAIAGNANAHDIALETPAPAVAGPASLSEEVRALRARVDALEATVNQLVKQLGGTPPQSNR